MADYKNCTCIACRTEFTSDDDVVVCPECGTPYHRDCWNANGHCINTELHESGGSWENPSAEKKEQKTTCPNCGEENDAANRFCTECGGAMNAEKSGFGGFSDASDGDGPSGTWRNPFSDTNYKVQMDINPEERIEGERLLDVIDYVGKNEMYYLTRFVYFRESKKKIMPNLVCMFVPELYFAYRKMWLWMIVAIAATFLLSIPEMLLTLVTQSDMLLAMMQSQVGTSVGAMQILTENFGGLVKSLSAHTDTLYWINSICSYITLILHILTFLFGNYLYYRHVLKNVKKERESKRSLVDVQTRIRIAGGASWWFVALAIFIQFVLTGIFTYAVMLL